MDAPTAKRSRPSAEDGAAGGLHASLHHAAAREWAEPHLHASQLMWPAFVRDAAEDRDVPGFAPNKQWGSANEFGTLVARCRELQRAGLASVMLFGVVADKDERGSRADAPDTPVARATRALRAALPGLFVALDVCLCEYTSHGHCGLLRAVEGEPERAVDNAATCARLADVALAYARAGAHMVCPSDMMDSRVRSIRAKLDEGGFHHVMIMAYTSKKASAFYAPFRDAVDSAFKGDRKRYQHPVGSAGLAMRALRRDAAEGADVVIVKPALFYGDIVRRFADDPAGLPVAVYVVSGEAVMLRGYADRTNDLETVLRESHVSMLRAGATILITYFTPEILGFLPRW